MSIDENNRARPSKANRGKKRDDLQDAIALIRGLKIEQPLQYVNFRD